METAVLLIDNEASFDLNFAKGFVFLKNKKNLEAFSYLTRAIELQPLIDTPYSLRATVSEDINIKQLDDAKEAVLLNSSARNHFVLTGKFCQSEIKKAIFHYRKALEINDQYACAYNNLALRYKELKNFESASVAYIKCVKIEPTHWCYYDLWFCLDKLGYSGEALEFAKTGFRYHPEDFRFYFALGVSYSKISDYKESIKNYKKYLLHYPEDDFAVAALTVVNSELAYDLLQKALFHFSRKDFSDSYNCFEEHLEHGKELASDHLHIYLKVLLMHDKPDALLGKNHPLYGRLSLSKYMFLVKTDRGEVISQEEEDADKLKIYQIDSKISFGKYAGHTIAEVARINISYIFWCVTNIAHFAVHPNIFQISITSRGKFYLDSLEINIVKLEFLLDQMEDDDGWDENLQYDDYMPRNHETYGYDSDTIDSAFEGDPENYWNID